MADSLEIISNFISVVAIVFSLVIFFTDQFRRWGFLGYRPTAVVLVFDRKREKVLLLERKKRREQKIDHPWHFPQGGIYSSDLNAAVERILQREFSMELSEYEFFRTITLGKKRIRNRRIEKKHHYGFISITPWLRGKGYIGCIVIADIDSILRKKKFGFDLDNIRIVSFNEALKLIDPDKAKMLKKVNTRIIKD